MKKIILIEKEIEACDFCEQEIAKMQGFEYEAIDWRECGAPVDDKKGILIGCNDCYEKYIRPTL